MEIGFILSLRSVNQNLRKLVALSDPKVPLLLEKAPKHI